jgi:hypothetical protein
MKSDSPQPLSDFIQVGARFLRSVNLEKDYAGGQRNGDYIITPTARQVLSRVAEGLRDNSPYRAWTITGPYGVGKSAFAVYLTRLFCLNGDSTTAARHQLQTVDPVLAERLLGSKAFARSRKGFFPILINGHRAATSLCLLQGIFNAVLNAKERQLHSLAGRLRQLLRRAQREAFLDSATVVTVLAEVNSIAVQLGYLGALVLIDELGKLFEFAARSPHKADVFVLQQLAEFASRSAAKPVFLIGLLHQSFEDYGQHLDLVSRKEWAKIQGRYEDVAFLEPADQVIRMIASAIRWKTSSPDPSLHKRIAATARLAADCGILPTGIRRDEFEAAAVAAYPLHPTTLVALPFLFRRFAQNERSLFSYLSSLEPFGFQSFLKQSPLDRGHPHFVRLEHLFDYFTQNFGLGLFRQPQARRWMEAADVLDRKDNLKPLHANLIKTVGILNALGEFSPLGARKPVIHYALADTLDATPDAASAFELLKDQSVLTYRKFNDTYRIWEGSDVDLDEKIAEGERKTRDALSLSTTLARYLAPRPLVARRHSYETGALRFFAVTYVDDTESLRQSIHLKSASDGRVVVCLSTSIAQVQQYRDLADELQPGHDDLLIAIPRDIGEIRAAASELAALRWVWENTPELRDDRAARRELALRIADAGQLLKSNVHRLLDPREDPVGSNCLWFYHGAEQAVDRPVEVSHLLSYVCDKLFNESPRIRNELIVRRSLSSASAAARRNLVEAMLTRAAQPTLGIEGYPPERSMYESVLRATGIHTKGPTGSWHISPPIQKHRTNLWPAWQHLSESVFRAQPEPQQLDKLFRSLAAAPYGVMEGLQPLLLCAFMIVHADEVTLYRERTFLPEPGIADFELLMRRPELLAIAGSRVKGPRAQVVSRLAKGLGTRPATVPVVKALFKMVRSLPEFAWHTNRIPEQVKQIRSAFDGAQSPERFLFVDLPQAVGSEPFSDTRTDRSEIETFFDRLNHNLQLMRRVMPLAAETARDQLLQACGFQIGPEGWQTLRQCAFNLESFATNSELHAFLRRINQSTNDAAGISSVLEFIASAPMNTWSDLDVDNFPSHARTIGFLFQEATSFQARHESSSILESLSTDQRRQADKLRKQLEEFLIPAFKTTDGKIIQAALFALARTFHQ